MVIAGRSVHLTKLFPGQASILFPGQAVTEISIGEKKNEQIKGLIRNMKLFFLLHNTTDHYQALY